MREKFLVSLVFVMLLAGVLPTNVPVGALSAGGLSTGSGAQSSIDWWPMFHHDLNHMGYSTSSAPNTNNTIWNYITSDWVESSPTVADGVVYIGSRDRRVYALNATTGALIWRYRTGDEVKSSPAVADGMVFFGSHDSNVYALNATTGALIWNYKTGEYPVASFGATVVEGVVYIGSNTGKLYALEATNGDLIWSYTTGGGIDSSPAVVGGKVYIGMNYDVLALDSKTGGLIWSYTTGGVPSSPAVVNDKVFIGSSDRNVYALNASTGEKIWNYTTGYVVQSSPALAYGMLYIASRDAKIYALNETTGSLIWSYTTEGEIGQYMFSSPAVADGIVFTGSQLPDKKVYALNATTGALIWSYTTGGAVWSSPAVANGKVYIGSLDGKVYAFGSPLLINNDDAYTTSLSVTLTFIASDATSGVVQMRFSPDNATWTPWEAYTTSKAWTLTTGDGTKTVYVQFKDNAGLISPSYSDTIILDKTPPTVSITSPLNGTEMRSSTVTVTWTGSDEASGISRFEARLNGDSWFNVGTDTTYNFTGLDDGSHTIEVKAIDEAGNSKVSSVSFTMNARAPGWMDDIAVFGVILGIVAVTIIFLLRRRKPKPPVTSKEGQA